jgi:uncharacterized protein YfbU (UPF0304 family)
VKLTNPEKLMLVMLAEIHDTVKVKDGIDTKLLKEAIYSNNTWALSWEMSGLLDGGQKEANPPEVDEVVDILDMWQFIEEAHEALGPKDRKKVETEAAPFGKRVRFSGFDGNHDSRLWSIASFLVDDMEKFSRFKGRDLNSHGSPPLDAYRRMLAIWDPIRATLDGKPMTADQIIQLLKAMTHPSHAAG